jgi:regulatory protein
VAFRSRPRQPKKLDREKLWDYALKTLGVKGLASGEMRTRLQRRAESPADVDGVMEKLKEYAYLDDRKFAENYATAKLENNGLGKQRVFRDLRQKRVGADLAEKVVTDTYAATDEVTLIEEYIAKKFRGAKLNQTLQDPAKLASAFRKLRYAGFSASNSIRVLKRYAANADELEEVDEPDPSVE